jgi:hypothetical protein
MIVTPNADDTILFVYVEDAIVVIVEVEVIWDAVSVVVVLTVLVLVVDCF